MTDIARLAENWYRLAPGLGGGEARVDADGKGIHFTTDDYQVHLHEETAWWIIDTANDRGERRNAAAKLSSFGLTEKYLIWKWATGARSSLASGALGADLARQGYAAGVDVSRVDIGNKICADSECAILSVVDATIFSHLMTKSTDELEQMTRTGVA